MSSDEESVSEVPAAAHPTALATADGMSAASRRGRRLRRVVAVVGSAVAVAAIGLGGLTLIEQRNQTPIAIDQTPDQPAPAGPDRDTGDEAAPALSHLAVASTMSRDGGASYESQFPHGPVVRAVSGGASYPDRLYGLGDGTVVWQGTGGIQWLALDGDTPTTLLRPPTDPAARTRLVGTGVLGDEAVVLVEEGRAASLQNDQGGTLSAYRLDGTKERLVAFSAAWEHAIYAASLRRGWLLYTEADGNTQTTILRAPNGSKTVVEQASDGESFQHAALAELDIAPGVAVVEHHLGPGGAGAPFGRARLEVRRVGGTDVSGDHPERDIELPTDGVPKQLAVAGELAYLTLLPDFPELVQVNLHTGDVRRFSAPGIVALHEDLEPLPPDAAPLASCADKSTEADDDAQPYVWLPCLDAATYEEGHPPATFWGIHKLRLVTDPRASVGGVAQRVEAMLNAIFAGPTVQEEQEGYGAIIDPSIEVLIDVTFDDGLVTIDVTEDGARAASTGTTARAVFQSTVNTAVFEGFVAADSLRVAVEGDCVAWSTYADGGQDCLTFHRDGEVTT